MWVRKTDEEVAQDRKRFAFGPPLFWGFFAFVISTSVLVSSSELWSKAIVRSLFGPVIGIAVYLWRLRIGKRKGMMLSNAHSVGVWVDEDAWMCSECHSVKHPRGSIFCECGGLFASIDYWKWVDD